MEGNTIRIILEPFEPEPPVEFGALVASIVTEEGDPLIYAEVIIKNDQHHFKARVHKDGNFEFEVPEGWYYITARSHGFIPFEGEVLIETNEILELEIILESEPPVEHGSLIIICVNEDGQSVMDHEGTAVALHEYLDIHYQTDINDYGNFFFEELAPGNYEVRLEIEGFYEAETSVEIPEGQSITITVQLEQREK